MAEQVELTHEQREKWDATMSMMLWTCPGYRYLFLKLLAEDNKNGKSKYAAVFTNDIPNAATDARNILINPEWFFKLKLAERVYVLSHEVQHNIYKDVEFLNRVARSGEVPTNDGKTLPFDMMTMQQSMDYRINALLNESKIGKAPEQGNFDPKTSHMDALLDVYQRHYKKKPKEDQNGDGQGGGGGQGSGFDELLPPGKSTGQSPDQAAERNDQKWGVEIAVAVGIEKSRGKAPAALMRMFQQILEPEIPWTEHIKGQFERKIGYGSKTWKRPNRRYIGRDLYLPSPSGFGAGWVAVGGDTSGSITGAELESYIGELAGIIEDCRPKRLSVSWCDARVAMTDEIEDIQDLLTIKARGVGGGGGTDFRPVFKYIDQQEEEPEVLVYFTDGYGTFPKRGPKYHVIWVMTTDVQPPWGETIRIHPKKQ